MKNLSKKICVGLILAGTIFPLLAFAQTNPADNPANSAFQLIPCNSANASQDTLTSNPTTCDYNALVLTVQRFINLLLYASGFIAVILVVFAGFKYLTAGGDTNKTTQARKILSAAVIGMIIAFCSWLVVNTVVNSFISSSFSGGVVVNPLKQQ